MMSIDFITLSDEKARENARRAANMVGNLGRQGGCCCRA
jgi:hypothetical protein